MQAGFEIDPAASYFPTTESCSIIGSSRLNFRVRDGNGCDPTDTTTGKLLHELRLSGDMLTANFQDLDT